MSIFLKAFKGKEPTLTSGNAFFCERLAENNSTRSISFLLICVGFFSYSTLINAQSIDLNHLFINFRLKVLVLAQDRN